MNHVSRFLTVLLALTLLLSLCACGAVDIASGPEEKPAGTQASKSSERFPVEGDYEIFAAGLVGQIRRSDDYYIQACLSLYADGTGKLVSENTYSGKGFSVDLTWTLTRGELEVAAPSGDAVGGWLRDGVAVLEIEPGFWEYFAVEGAETGSYFPDSRLSGYMETLDPESGIHLSYTWRSISFDVHCKSDTYYSLSTEPKNGFLARSVTFIRDGEVYDLNPFDMTGYHTQSGWSGTISADRLYRGLQDCSYRTEFREETREYDGASYTVEVFPAPSEEYAEIAVYYNDAGQPAVYREYTFTGTTITNVETYVILSIDDAVDESLFDISGYKIK